MATVITKYWVHFLYSRSSLVNYFIYSSVYQRRQWEPTPVLLPGKSHGWSLVGYSPWGRKELDMTERVPFHFSLLYIGEGNGNPLQCSCLENPRDGGAWWAAIYGVKQSRTWLKRLSNTLINNVQQATSKWSSQRFSNLLKVTDSNWRGRGKFCSIPSYAASQHCWYKDWWNSIHQSKGTNHWYVYASIKLKLNNIMIMIETSCQKINK